MGAAPIRACHRRALRHPVPQAPERAFIVARARRKAFLWLRRGFFSTHSRLFTAKATRHVVGKNGKRRGKPVPDAERRRRVEPQRPRLPI